MRSVLLLIISISVLACTKDKKCKIPVQTIGSGVIAPLRIVSDSIIMLDMRTQSYVIQSDSANFENAYVYNGNDAPRDSIDFSNYTLLGKYASGTCQVSYERNVTRDDVQKKVHYYIKVHECGACMSYSESMNWVLVPKIPADYDVIFHVE